MEVRVRRLGPGDAGSVRAMMALFHAAFDGDANYTDAPPTAEYLEALLRRDHVIMIAAEVDDLPVGGIVAYEMAKPEQARSEIYIYDLAVSADHRRLGVATSMIHLTQQIATDRGAHVVFVQADHGDDAAVALYTKLGTAEEVLHFDLDR